VAGEPAPRAPSAGPLGPVIDALLQADPARRPDAATAARMLAEVSAGPGSADGPERIGLGGLAGLPGEGRPSPVGTPRFSDQPGAGPRSFLDAPSLLDQPEFLHQSGLLNPPGDGPGSASGFAPPRRRGRQGRRWRGGRGGRQGRGGRRGRGQTAAITAIAVIAAGLAGYAAYPRPAGGGTGENTSSGTGGTDAAGAAGASAGGGAAGSARAGTPAGYRWYQVTPAASGTVAGFEIAVPDAWRATRQSLDSILRSPGSGALIEVSLAPFRYARPLREAKSRQAQAISHDPGYHLTGLRTGTFLGGADAVWEFSSQHAGTRVSVEELLVSIDTTAGTQGYTLAVSAPPASFGPAQAVFRQALATFQPVP
jgi:hypothetical protein